MKVNPRLLIGLALVLIFGYFLQDLIVGSGQYAAGIRKERQQKNDAFRRGNTSPLSTQQRATFDSLHYFAPDKNYRLAAQYTATVRRDTVELPLTTGKTEKYLRYGQAMFILNKQEYKLTLFRRADGRDSTLFVPFTDKTNGFASYGGGRYLDAPRPAPDDEEILLDFNAAYNPYCAYNNSYACPVPPADNRLPVAINAGEKSFHE